MKRIIFSLVFVALLVVPARAQLVVVDPGNLTQTIAVAPGLQNIQGESVSTLTLAGDSGAVLIK